MYKIFTLKASLAFLLVTLFPIWLFGQSIGTINGEVITKDGKALAYASVRIKDTKISSSVQADGHFSLQVPAGHHVFQVTYANYTVFEEEVDVKSGAVLELAKIVVQANSTQLREIVVSDIQRNKFARKETEGVAKMPLANLENPQVYSVVTKDLMMELGATDYISALAQSPGAVITNGINDSGNGVTMRGFSSTSSGTSGIVRNGMPIASRAVSEVFNLERVEVIKGPSATLFGAQAPTYGGLINNVTKKPFESFRGEVSYLTGSFGMNRLTADVNTPLNESRTALGRFNVMGTLNNSFQNEGRERSMGFASSLLFKANSRSTVRFDMDIYNTTKPLVAFIRNTNKLSYTNMKDYPIPHDRSFTSNDVATARSNINIGAELEYKLSENWTSHTSYLFNNTGDKGSVFMVPMIVDDQRVERRYRIFDDYSLNFTAIQQNFNGAYEVAKVKNKVLLGLDATLYTDKSTYMVPYFAILDTVRVTDPVWKPLTRADVDASRPKRSHGDGIDESKYQVYSAYVSNVTNISDRLFVMLSARVNAFRQGSLHQYNPGQPEVRDENGKIEQKETKASYKEVAGYNQVNVSPKIGIVYQPIKDQVSVFANYMNSFRNIPPSQGISNPLDDNSAPELQKWKPEQAYQFEVGTKLELFGDKLNATLSYYDITVKDKLRTVLNDVSAQDGELNSKGFEVDIISSPVRGWNIIAGYGYNDNKYTKSEANLVGKRSAWSPKNVANLWTSYKFLDNGLKGLGFGAGLNYQSESIMNIQDDFYIPASTVVNGSVFYDQAKYRLGLKFNNLTNLKYWDLYGKPQKPFEFLANISFKF